MNLNRNSVGRLNRIVFWSWIATALICAVAHVVSFFSAASLWLLPAALLLPTGAVICKRVTKTSAGRLTASAPQIRLPAGTFALVGAILLIYSAVLFVYMYKTTGGATAVGIVQGQYVYEYKSHVIRAISEREYTMFPARAVRLLSAWMGMAAAFELSEFEKSAR